MKINDLNILQEQESGGTRHLTFKAMRGLVDNTKKTGVGIMSWEREDSPRFNEQRRTKVFQLLKSADMPNIQYYDAVGYFGGARENSVVLVGVSLAQMVGLCSPTVGNQVAFIYGGPESNGEMGIYGARGKRIKAFKRVVQGESPAGFTSLADASFYFI